MKAASAKATRPHSGGEIPDNLAPRRLIAVAINAWPISVRLIPQYSINERSAVTARIRIDWPVTTIEPTLKDWSK